MLRERRLRRSADFAAVYRRGRSVSADTLSLRALRSGGSVSRFGFSIGKRVGKAVVRNRVKRRLRAAAGSLPISPGWDVVVSARPAAATCGYAELRDTLAALLARARLLATVPQAAGDASGVSDVSARAARGSRASDVTVREEVRSGEEAQP